MAPRAVLLTLAYWFGSSACHAADSPADLIRQAIAAAGGQDRADRAGRSYVRVEGTFCQGGANAPFEARLWRDGPERSRLEMGVRFPSGEDHTTLVTSGGAAWAQVAGQSAGFVADTKLAVELNSRYCAWVTGLAPLTSDKSFVLTSLGEATVRDRKADGVGVRRDGRPEVRLWFDRDTRLLVKTEMRTDGGPAQEDYLGEYKDFAGLKRATTRTSYRGGEKGLEARVVEFRALDRVDDTLFATPGSDTPDPRGVVRRHLAAAGGADRLRRLSCEYYRQSVKRFDSGGTIEAENEFWSDYRDAIRDETLADTPQGRVRRTVVYSGGGGWWRVNNDPVQPLPPDAVADWRSRLVSAWTLEVSPLLDDPAASLAPLGRGDVGGRPAVGVRVTRPGWPGVALWFDVESGLLAKRVETGPDGRPFEKYMTDYTERDGVKRPTRVRVEHAGRLNAEVLIRDHRHYERLDPALLARPSE